MAAIFISHSSRDNETAAEIKFWLSGQGYENVFLDFDKDTGLGAGRDWERQLYEAVERCHAMILVVTPAWMASKWCFAEERIGRALGKSIFPIVLSPDDIKIIGPELHTVQAALWDAEGQGHLGKRLSEIATEIARGYRFDQARPPWPGIFSFEAEDAAVFFGRDPEIRKVAELLETRRLHGGNRLLLIVGASGSGKSSLMKAGVLPYVARGEKRFVTLPPFRPGATPLTAFAKVLAEALGRRNDWQAIRDALRGETARDALAGFLEDRRVGPSHEATILIAIDQFEELFTIAGEAERAAFLALLAFAASRERPLPALVLATVRSDLLGEVLKAETFNIGHETWTLGSLSADRLADVIEGPARVAAVHLQAGLVEQILRDVGSSTEALPLLAFALRELYERYGADKKLTLDEYEKLGDRNLRPLENAVRRKAEETLAATSPSPDELAALKEAFVGALVRVNEEGVRLRRPARREDLPEPSRRLIERLVEARILSTRTEGEAKFVEVAHEALFRAWPQLSVWLEEEQDFLIGRRQIEEAERQWIAAPETQRNKALLAGLLLEKAREWMLAFPDRLRNVRGFVLASIQKDEAERTRVRRRLRVLTFASAAAAVVFVTLGVFAAFQWIAAEEAQEVARGAQQIAQQERIVAEQARAEAYDLAQEAEAQAEFARRAQEQALANSTRAEEATAEAEEQQRRAEAAREEAERQAQVAQQERASALAAQQEARTAQEQAAESAAEADKQRNEALRRQSLFLADQANQRTRSGDAATGVLLSLEALPQAGDQIRPYTPEAEAALYRAHVRLREKRVLSHQTTVGHAAFSPDGTRLVTGSNDGMVQMWSSVGDWLATLEGHSGTITSLDFSFDGKLVLTASEDGTARVWNAENGDLVTSLTGHTGEISTARFSPDASLIVTASQDATGRIWKVSGGPALFILKGGDDRRMTSAVFSPDGKFVLTSSHDYTARIWDSTTGQQLKVLEGHTSALWRAEFSRDGRLVVTSAMDQEARVWSTETGLAIAALKVESIFVQARFSPDGSRVVGSTFDNDVWIWDFRTGSRTFIESDGLTRDIVLSRDGKFLALKSGGRVRIIDLATREEILALGGHSREIASATFSPDGRHLVTTSWDETARIWNLGSDRSSLTLNVLPDCRPLCSVETAVLDSTGTRILTASEKGVALWNAMDGSLVSRLTSAGAKTAGFSEDGKRAVIGQGSEVVVWDLDGNRALVRRDVAEYIQDAAFSADGTIVAVTFGENAAGLFDAATLAPVQTFKGHTDSVWSIAFSPDQSQVLTGSIDGTARIWDVSSGETIRILQGHTAQVFSAAFSPDGRKIATASADETIRLWDAETGEVINVIEEPSANVNSVAFSGDSLRIVTASQDELANVWRPDLDQSTAYLEGHQNWVTDASFSADGRRVVTAAHDGTARIWPVYPTVDELIDEAKATVPRCLTRDQRDEAYLEPEPPEWCIEMAKWPYRGRDWKDWLAFKRANLDPPFPDSAEWGSFISAHPAN